MSGGIDRREIKNDACPGDLGQHIRQPEIANPAVYTGFTHSGVLSPRTAGHRGRVQKTGAAASSGHDPEVIRVGVILSLHGYPRSLSWSNRSRRNRHATLDDKKEAIRLLADVFEWLKDTKQLQKALVRKDESDLFNIANNFSIRHHEQAQKANYDQAIWYNWMFHFYLATYHASVRLLIKQAQKPKQSKPELGA